ncbi:phosphatase PAP2/dual specificity phosphatase family protein [Luteimonas sp. RD2P54]|uniref:Phosphatase PAP2/dual specificity phosphatase family protein n=1 Tax=Luteimonas endophytica TaxID=3042023 RepID=A0ABT6JA98_9GAMM|nr:phosphatase PAP2/dual specificity phosphatase family protein [Luteimonas endophytica]MDH5823123.1 phosphatase PAP2/dual specificity phosphatase family protein [Luteimonas endophytica]
MEARAPGRPWKRALAWLALLGPFFYASYGFANAMAARREDVPSIVFGWEQAVPFLAWTIVPYWTTNLFYAASPFLCRDRRELDTHCLRLLSVQVLAVSCFLLWPLAFSFERPASGGVFAGMFAALEGFDRPYNQAPSLHIAITVVLWTRYSKVLRGAWRWLLHGWFALVCASVLTTFQHHFIDIPTGLAAGWLCVWLWPERTTAPWRGARLAADPARWRLAGLYTAAAVACGVTASLAGGAWLWLWWPALSLGLVAGNYAWFGASGFQKRGDGRLSTAARWLYAPYLAAAWINSRAWTRRRPAPVEVADGVWLGRLPGWSDRERCAVVDVCAELSLPGGTRPGDRRVPMLDLVAPPPDALREAAVAIEDARRHGQVLVCCALGYSRSALAVAAWLLATGRAPDADGAIGRLRAARPEVVLREAHRHALLAAQTPPAATLAAEAAP